MITIANYLMLATLMSSNSLAAAKTVREAPIVAVEQIKQTKKQKVKGYLIYTVQFIVCFVLFELAYIGAIATSYLLKEQAGVTLVSTVINQTAVGDLYRIIRGREYYDEPKMKEGLKIYIQELKIYTASASG